MGERPIGMVVRLAKAVIEAWSDWILAVVDVVRDCGLACRGSVRLADAVCEARSGWILAVVGVARAWVMAAGVVCMRHGD